MNRLFSVKHEERHKIIYFLGIKLKFRKKEYRNLKNTNLEKRIFQLEMQEVLNSGLWDAEYYIKKYHPDMKKMEALRYYMREGYKKNERPSAIFDTSKYYKIANENPVLDFIRHGRYELSQGFFKNEYPVSEEYITQYLYYKESRKASNVVYTCVTGNYDSIENLQGFYYTDFNWDYICFTDNEEYIKKGQIGIWQILPLQFDKLDNVRNNRWHKLHPHILFPQYEESVYIDANINILTSKFFDMVNTTNKDILLPIHSNRIDLYKEINWAKEMNFDKDSKILDSQYDIIKKSGFPENYGMFENNIIYRKHWKKEIMSMMEEWWYFVENYSQRDQTSLAYIFWKHKRRIDDYAFENTRIDYKNFCIFKHTKEYNLCKF